MELLSLSKSVPERKLNLLKITCEPFESITSNGTQIIARAKLFLTENPQKIENNPVTSSNVKKYQEDV